MNQGRAARGTWGGQFGITIDPRLRAPYTFALKMNALTAMRYSYFGFTYRYPYGVAATVKRMRAGVART